MLERREQRLGLEHNCSPHRRRLRENSTDRGFGDDRRGRARARETSTLERKMLRVLSALSARSSARRACCRDVHVDVRVRVSNSMVLVGRKTSPTGLLLCSPWRVTLTLLIVSSRLCLFLCSFGSNNGRSRGTSPSGGYLDLYRGGSEGEEAASPAQRLLCVCLSLSHTHTRSQGRCTGEDQREIAHIEG